MGPPGQGQAVTGVAGTGQSPVGSWPGGGERARGSEGPGLRSCHVSRVLTLGVS